MIIDASLMFLTWLLTSSIGFSAALDLLCPEGCGGGWVLPMRSWPVLFYWVLIASVASYLLQMHANARIPSSTLAAYTAFQPVTAALLSTSIAGIFPGSGLQGARWSHLAAFGVLGGMALVIRDPSRSAANEQVVHTRRRTYEMVEPSDDTA